MPPIVDDLKMNNVLAYQSSRFGIRIADQERALFREDTSDLRPALAACSLSRLAGTR